MLSVHFSRVCGTWYTKEGVGSLIVDSYTIIVQQEDALF